LEHFGEGHGDDGEYGIAGGGDDDGNEGCLQRTVPYFEVIIDNDYIESI
jgi:hypothetical protein